MADRRGRFTVTRGSDGVRHSTRYIGVARTSYVVLTSRVATTLRTRRETSFIADPPAPRQRDRVLSSSGDAVPTRHDVVTRKTLVRVASLDHAAMRLPWRYLSVVLSMDPSVLCTLLLLLLLMLWRQDDCNQVYITGTQVDRSLLRSSPVPISILH